MYSVRKLLSEHEFKNFMDIVAEAYPGFKLDTPEYMKIPMD
jgi:hypothetical protein